MLIVFHTQNRNGFVAGGAGGRPRLCTRRSASVNMYFVVLADKDHYSYCLTPESISCAARTQVQLLSVPRATVERARL